MSQEKFSAKQSAKLRQILDLAEANAKCLVFSTGSDFGYADIARIAREALGSECRDGSDALPNDIAAIAREALGK